MGMRIDDFKREDNTDLDGYWEGIIHHRGHGEHRGRKRKDSPEARRAQECRGVERRGSLGTPFSGMARPRH